MEALLPSEERIAHEERAVAAELRALKRKRADEERRSSQTFGSKFVKYMCLVLYALCNYEVAAAAHYLQVWRKKNKREELDTSVLYVVVETWFLEWPDDKLGDLFDPPSAWHERLHQHAATFLREYELAEWVGSLNLNKGIAPTTEMVCDHMGALVKRDMGIDSDRGNLALSKNRSWAYKWRWRWDVGIGRVKMAAVLPVEEIRQKVGF